MALKVKHTEMNGNTSRWVTRDEAKTGSKKVRRKIDVAETIDAATYGHDLWNDRDPCVVCGAYLPCEHGKYE